MDQRPNLDRNISVKDFKDFYWLKKELTTFCKEEGILRTGGKIEIAARICHYLETGEKIILPRKKQSKFISKFDWKKEVLTHETLITDNYQNTENVRSFFKEHIGSSFKFNVRFMNWMKANTGKTLKDAISIWQQYNAEKKALLTSKVIAPQFEYNTYLRDFLADNPDLDRKTGIALWKIKKARRGNNIYQKTDLHLLK